MHPQYHRPPPARGLPRDHGRAGMSRYAVLQPTKRLLVICLFAFFKTSHSSRLEVLYHLLPSGRVWGRGRVEKEKKGTEEDASKTDQTQD